MFKVLSLRNFQSHTLTSIELDKHVTTIIGPSARGKTGVMRALDLLCLNRTRGKSFIRNRKGICRVKLQTENCQIERRVGKSENSYLLNERRYVSFGTSKVPDDIEKALRCSPVNFQRQLDPVFLLSESSARVSRQLNEVIALDTIDSTLASIASETREAEKQQTLSEESLREAKEEIESLAWADQLASSYNQQKSVYEALEKARAEIASLSGRVDRATKLRRIKRRAAAAKLDARLLIATGARLARLRKSITRLTKATVAAEQLTGLKHFLEDAESLAEFRKKADRLAHDNRNLEMLIDNAVDKRRQLKAFNYQAELSQKAMNKLSKERCPLCGRRSTNNAKESSHNCRR